MGIFQRIPPVPAKGLRRRGRATLTAAPAPVALALEPRYMFDAAGAATAAEAATDDAAQDAAETAVAPERREVAVVDTSVDDHEALVEAAEDAGMEVILISGGEDGLSQLAEALRGREGIDALHILSHGDVGMVGLGGDILTADTLGDHAEALAIIGGSLSEDGDVLLYGCRVSDGEAGQDFIGEVALLTGADVAASTDATGNDAHGGNWFLERSTGPIEATTPFGGGVPGFEDTLAYTGTFGFDNSTNVDPGAYSGGPSYAPYSAADDASWTVDGSYTLVADGTQSSTYHYAGQAWIAGNAQAESSLKLSFTNNETFTFNGLYFKNASGADRTLKITSDTGQTYTASGALSHEGTVTVSGLNWTGVSAIYVTTTEGDFISIIDNLDIANLTNAASPAFTDSGPFSVGENATGGTTVGDVNANDGEGGGADANITYTIQSGNSNLDSDGNDLFSIDANTGVITINDADDLDYEDATSHTLTIRATNSGSGTTTDETVTINVTNQNDAPTFTGNATLASEAEDASDPAGQSISTLFGGTFSDVDGDSLAGVAITADAANASTEGRWQYTTDGSTWHDVGAVSTSGALLLQNDANVKLRFSGVADYNGTPGGLTVHAVDDSATTTWTSGAARQTFDTTTDDATSKVSAAGASLGTSITAVNDAPSVDGPGSGLAATEGTALDIHGQGFTVSDVDAGSGTLTATLAAGEGTLTVSAGDSGVSITSGNGTGSVVLSGTVAQLNALLTGAGTGTITYAAVDAPSASTSVTLTVNDGGNTGADPGDSGDGSSEEDSASVTVTITATNDAPTATGVSGSVSVTEDTASNLDLSGVTLSDPDSGASDVTLTIAAGSGTMTASSGGGVVVGGSGTGTLALTGSVADINTFLGTASNIQYTGPSNAHGTGADSLTLTANDGGNSGTGGGTDVALGSISVDITAVADTPSVTDASTTPGTQTTSGLVISRSADDGTEVTHFKITGITNGTLYKADGTTQITAGSFITYAEAQAGLKFTPSGGGDGSFDVQASTANNDSGLGGGTVTATISVGIAVESKSIAEDTSSSTVDITRGDVSQTHFKITGITGGKLYSDAGLTTEITNGSFVAVTGATTTVYFVPTGDYSGSGGFQAQASTDGADSGLGGNVATSTITVTAVNDAPTVGNPGSPLAATEGTALDIHGQGFTVSDVDSGSGTLTATLAAGEGTLTVSAGDSGATVTGGNGTGTVTVTGTAAQLNALLTGAGTGTITYAAIDTPAASTTVTVTVNDGGNTGADPGNSGDGSSEEDSASVTVNITATNDAPTATGVPASVTVTEDTASDVDLSGVTLGDVDAGGNPITLTIAATDGTLAATSGGGVTVGGSGGKTLTLTGSVADINTFLGTSSNIQYTGAANAFGTAADSLTLTANDGGNTGTGGGTDVALGTVDVDITGTPDTPVAAGTIADQTTTTGDTWTFTVPSDVLVDPDNDPLTWSATLDGGAPLPGWLSFNPATRTFSGVPPTATTLTIAVSAEEAGGATASTSFDVTVEAPPVTPEPPAPGADPEPPPTNTPSPARPPVATTSPPPAPPRIGEAIGNNGPGGPGTSDGIGDSGAPVSASIQTRTAGDSVRSPITGGLGSQSSIDNTGTPVTRAVADMSAGWQGLGDGLGGGLGGGLFGGLGGGFGGALGNEGLGQEGFGTGDGGAEAAPEADEPDTEDTTGEANQAHLPADDAPSAPTQAAPTPDLAILGATPFTRQLAAAQDLGHDRQQALVAALAAHQPDGRTT